MNRKLLIIELNEFNTDLLRKGSNELGLSNIKRMLNMKHSKTFTENLAHGELDPWVQWVSVHIGMPHSIHKITRLGELPDSNHLQLWEKLSKKNISAGIWGPMNASRSSATHCRFFLPDPWSFSELAFPRSLNKFLALPRYYAKNYIAPSLKELIKALSGTARFFLSFKMLDILKKELFNTIKSLIKYGINNPVLFCLFDIYSTRAFIKYKNNYDPQFSVLFLNSIAHLQHHKWETESINKLMAFCLQSIDRILGLLFDELNKDESVIIMNALSQRNTKGENHFIYRQIKPHSFLELLDINYETIEQCMTNDAHVFFSNKEERDRAFNKLVSFQLCGENLFYVELKGKHQLFYQIEYFKYVKEGTKFQLENKTYDFYDHFTLLIEQTGSHVPCGDIFYQGLSLDSEMKNHELHNYIIDFYSR